VPSQDGGYVLLWQRYDINKMADVLLWQRYDNNKMADMRYYGNVILHLQQYSHRLNLLCFFLKNDQLTWPYISLLILQNLPTL